MPFKQVFMKKLYTLLVIAFIGFLGNAQIVNIPDANFKAKLIALGVDTNTDGEIQEGEAAALFDLDISNSNISDLTGINYFTNLNTLDCSYNSIQSIDINSSLDSLNSFRCDYNLLQSLDVSSLTALQYLICSENQLLSLNIGNLQSLGSILCSNNQLQSLNLNNLSSLQSLYCDLNQLQSLDLNGLPSLQYLSCYTNQLNSLDLTGCTNLTTLNCSQNQITSLNITGLTNISSLNYSFNYLPNLNLFGLPLTTLSCSGNQITSLNVSPFINLEYLDCSSNQLPSLDLSGLTDLLLLYCQGNQLQSLNVTELTGLNFLNCNSNQLASLNVSGLINLQTLQCSFNQITSLNITGLTNIQTLTCYNNQLQSLDVTALTNLQSLYCYGNQLATLFIKNGYIEITLDFSSNPNLQYICADEGQIASIQNLITLYGYTNCHVNSYCSFIPGGTFYTIQGNNRYDSNSNGCDAADINFPNLKLSFTDGINTGNLIADTSGAFHYDVQAGTQTITPTLENPTYFTVSPTTATVTFPTTTSPFVQDFCITAIGVHNDLEVSILPLNVARPGFDATYKIIYKNKGTGTQSGNLNLAFDDARLDFVSAVPTVNSQATNSLTWNYANLNPFETREILITMNVNSPAETPAVNSGDVLSYTATIVGATDETPNDNVSVLNQTVFNSFDPNDKTCLEGTTITPAMIGNYVHYVIRFENTGTFAAQNVVVIDVIDASKFDINTLIPQTSSHNFVTRINGNKAEFIFENINLPFDDANNDGYVAFKIKTKPTLVLGDTFRNAANIYFDYNFPILTNTATTTIATLGNQDFDFGSVFTLSPVPAKNSLTITTKQNVIVTSLSIYNTLGQVVQVNTNPNETIDVSGLQSGSYFIRIMSDKGIATGKFIKE